MQPKHFYEFDRFCLYEDERRLLRDSEIVSLTPKEFELLLVLVKHSGKLVTYDELKKTVWPESRHVEDKTLTQIIYTLRGVLGDSSKEQRYIETVPKRGYRFVASVREVQTGGAELIAEKLAETPPTTTEGEQKTTVQDDAENTSGQQPAMSKGNQKFKPWFMKPSVVSIAALMLCITIGIVITRRMTGTPEPPRKPSPGGKVEVEVWWPKNGSRVSGTQPFKAMATNLALPQYTLYWQVDGDRLNLMVDSFAEYPHKEIPVDLSGWTWKGAGPYKVNFVAKDLNGDTIAQQAIDIYVE